MLSGTQQIASTQIFLSLSIVAEFALIVWLVLSGRGIRGLAEAYLARTVINDGLTIWWARRQLKWLRLSPRYLGRMAHGLRFLDSNREFAARFIDRVRQSAERGEIAFGFEILSYVRGIRDEFRYAPTKP